MMTKNTYPTSTATIITAVDDMMIIGGPTNSTSSAHSLSSVSPSSTAPSLTTTVVGVATAPKCTQIKTLLKRHGDLLQTVWVNTSLVSLYALIFCLGMIGNCGIIISIGRRKKHQVVANIFLVNLAIVDCLLCLTALPIGAFSLIVKEWHFGMFLCKFIPLCQGSIVLITSLSLSFIAIDRFMNIVKATLNPWTNTTAIILTIGSWILGGGMNIPLYQSHALRPLRTNATEFCGLFCGEYNWVKKAHRQIYGTVMLGLHFIVPIVLMTFCYVEIMVKVQKEMLVTWGHSGHTQQSAAIRRKRRTMVMLILMVVAFIVSWLPLTILNTLRDYSVKIKFVRSQPYFFQATAHCIAMSSVVWNPILYFWMSRTQSKLSKARARGESLATSIKCRKMTQEIGTSKPDTGIVRRLSNNSNNNNTARCSLEYSTNKNTARNSLPDSSSHNYLINPKTSSDVDHSTVIRGGAGGSHDGLSYSSTISLTSSTPVIGGLESRPRFRQFHPSLSLENRLYYLHSQLRHNNNHQETGQMASSSQFPYSSAQNSTAIPFHRSPRKTQSLHSCSNLIVVTQCPASFGSTTDLKRIMFANIKMTSV